MSTSGRGINWRPRLKLVVRLARSVFFAAGASAERRSPSLVCELTETDCRVHAVLRQPPEGASVHQLETAGWVYISRQYPAENEPRPLSHGTSGLSRMRTLTWVRRLLRFRGRSLSGLQQLRFQYRGQKACGKESNYSPNLGPITPKGTTPPA